MNPIGPSFHLLIEPIETPASPDAPPAAPPRLEIPEEPAFLETTDDGASRRAAASASPGARAHPALLERATAPPAPAVPPTPFIVQPVREGPSPLLLLLVPGGRQVIVNGSPAPPVSLLAEGDEVILDERSGAVAHVALFHRASIGPPRPEEIGVTCPLCLVPVEPDTTLYRCFHCGKPLHLEPEARPEGERLECARLCTECPSCHVPIRMETGYGRLPEFYPVGTR